jgi:hypothetical protein
MPSTRVRFVLWGFAGMISRLVLLNRLKHNAPDAAKHVPDIVRYSAEIVPKCYGL